MIPSDPPLPHSSSNIKMSQREKDELAEQWYAMMIKDDVDSQQDVSTLTHSISAGSSKDDLQEQRDPNNRTYQRRGDDGNRFLDKPHRDHTDEYQYKRGFSKSVEPNNNSKTDFLDGIIQSLSELSKGDKKSESKSILQEKKNGWSIHDSQRRMQERRSQRQLQEQNANAGVSYNYQPQNNYGYEDRRRRSPDAYGPRSRPTVRRSREREDPVTYGRRSSSRNNGDHMFDESDDSQLSSSKYMSYSSGNSRSEYSGNIRAEFYTAGNNKSQRSGRTMPGGDSSTYSFRKARSWNIDKSLRSNEKSLFDVPTSPESNQTPEKAEMILPLESSSSLGSDKHSFQQEQSGKRKPVSRDQRTTSLASSSSKDAGKILQHFMPTSCGPVNGAVDGKGAFNTVVEFFDDPIKNLSPRAFRKSTGENFPSRSRSNSVKKTNRSSSNTRRSYEPFPPESDGKIPKTMSQQGLEREILRGMNNEPEKLETKRVPPMSSERRVRKNTSGTRVQNEVKQNSQSDDFEAIWGEPEDRQPPAETSNARFSIGGKAIVPPQFGSNLGSIAASVMSRSCNSAGHDSLPKIRDNKSASSKFMFEKIQSQLSNQSKNDSLGKSSTEHEQRIQDKLDAVRAKSLRNFQRMENEKQNPKSTDESFDPFGNGEDPRSTSKTTEGEQSIKNNIQGKRLEKIFDINTDILDDLAKRSNTNKSSGEKHIQVPSGSDSDIKIATSPRIVPQNSSREHDISHYMYVAYSQFGDDAQKVLKLCGHHTMPTPDRRKGQILVRINASTISATDCAIRRGEWKNMSMDPYIIPGVALVGKAMGREKKKPRPSSSNIEPGDNVLTLVRSGANARYICLQKHLLIKVPPKLHPDRVVCLAETYLTAFQALHLGQRGGIRYRENSLQGQSILIMNAYSPVGKAIIELARLGGAAICYGLINDESEDREGTGLGDPSDNIHQQYKAVEEWGAIPLPPDPQEWLTLIGRQIDILITSHDPNQGYRKGNGRVTADHWKALKKEGQVHAICAHPGLSELEQRHLILGSQPSSKPMEKAFRIPSCRPGGKEKMADRAMFYNLFDSWEGDRLARVMSKNDLVHLVKLLEANLIHPEIAERVPLSKIAKAQRSLDLNTVIGAGHLICSPWMRDMPKEQQMIPQSGRRTPKDTAKYVI